VVDRIYDKVDRFSRSFSVPELLILADILNASNHLISYYDHLIAYYDYYEAREWLKGAPHMYFFDEPLIEMPLWINSEDTRRRILALWRLKIGR